MIFWCIVVGSVFILAFIMVQKSTCQGLGLVLGHKFKTGGFETSHRFHDSCLRCGRHKDASPDSNVKELNSRLSKIEKWVVGE